MNQENHPHARQHEVAFTALEADRLDAKKFLVALRTLRAKHEPFARVAEDAVLRGEVALRSDPDVNDALLYGNLIMSALEKMDHVFTCGSHDHDDLRHRLNLGDVHQLVAACYAENLIEGTHLLGAVRATWDTVQAESRTQVEALQRAAQDIIQEAERCRP